MFCHTRFASAAFSCSVISISPSQPVQVMLVIGAELALAQYVPLPRLDLRHDERQQPQSVVRRQDRDAEHVAVDPQHEQRLHRGADLERLLRDLVARGPVEELAQRLSPTAGGRRAIVRATMSELIAVAAVAVVAWFAWGTIANVRKGRELMRWMQGGLPALGERTTVRWLGSSVVEMT